MIIFTYDKTFEGLLTAVFDAYERKMFPDVLLETGTPLPLFYDQVFSVVTEDDKSKRVWKGLSRKLSRGGLSFLTTSWLSELPGLDILLFRFMRKAIDAPHSVELNFGDADVLKIAQIYKKVGSEGHRVIQFSRFQKTADGTYFAALEPLYDVLPLTIRHFRDRFADQKWMLYDLKRRYGFYYDLKEVRKVEFNEQLPHLISGKVNAELLAEDEKLFQRLWKEYFHTLTIKQRINPRLQRQHLPVRFWKYLTEKQ